MVKTSHRRRHHSRKGEKEDYVEGMRRYRESLGKTEPKIDDSLEISKFEEDVIENRIGQGRRDLIRNFGKDLVKKQMQKRFEQALLDYHPIQVGQTPVDWVNFVFQNRMSNVVNNVATEMTRLAQERYGSAFSVRSQRENDLKKSGFFGGKYQGYGFYIHYDRDRIPSKLLQM